MEENIQKKVKSNKKLFKFLFLNDYSIIILTKKYIVSNNNLIFCKLLSLTYYKYFSLTVTKNSFFVLNYEDWKNEINKHKK